MKTRFIMICTAPFLFCSLAHAGTDIELMKGSCQKLVADSRTLTACDGKLININPPDGTTGFYFSEADGTVVTFSGVGNKQVKLNADEVMQPVNKIIYTVRAGSPVSAAATGVCHYTNPFKGKAIVDCSATTSMGKFEGKFQTDGRPPVSGP